jgi:arsenite/tail-anchored protein-transporting ATPase
VRVVLYTGKGGVGKTTTSAATAVLAASRGVRTLVASADAAHSLGDVLDARLGPAPQRVAERLDAVEIDARAETERHWGAIRDYLVSIFRYQGIEEVVADELALLPGAEELTTLLAVEAHARRGGYGLVVVDCAPTDSALRLLTLPEVARGALRVLLRVQRALAGVVTPLARSLVAVPLPDAAVFRDAEDLLYRKLRRLRAWVGHRDTTTRLVVTPERMVIDEALRAHTDLALFELACDAVVMNRLLPEAAAKEDFFRDWGRLQVERLREVEELFAPLPVLVGPLQDDEVVGLERLARQGTDLFGTRAPEARLARPGGIRFRTTPDGGCRAALPLPHARPDALDVVLVDDQLVVTTGSRRRTLPLPRRLAHLDLVEARLEGGLLLLRLAPPAGGAAPGASAPCA